MTYVRVKQNDTGHELSVDSEWAKRFAEGYTVLEDKDATDRAGDPLPTKYNTSVDDAAAQQAESGRIPWIDRRKAELEAEVAARNASRTEADLIVVDAPGNKAELAAALDADDKPDAGSGSTTTTSTEAVETNQSGQKADPEGDI